MGFQESLLKLLELPQWREGDNSLGVWAFFALKLSNLTQTHMSRQLRNFNQ